MRFRFRRRKNKNINSKIRSRNKKRKLKSGSKCRKALRKVLILVICLLYKRILNLKLMLSWRGILESNQRKEPHLLTKDQVTPKLPNRSKTTKNKLSI